MSIERRLIVMRHGERLDDIYPDWLKPNENGKYQIRDLNMPTELPTPNRPLQDYDYDPVLTVTGDMLAGMVGSGMEFNGIYPDYVYSSPALRCVQTAHAILSALGIEKEQKIMIEPSLFENIQEYPKGMPNLLSTSELKDAGFNIDLNYTPLASTEQFFAENEDFEDYSRRVHKFMTLFFYEQVDVKTVLLVGHASTLDVAFGLLKEPERITLPYEFVNIADRYPYCSTAIFERENKDEWYYNDFILGPITYTDFSSSVDKNFALRDRCE